MQELSQSMVFYFSNVGSEPKTWYILVKQSKQWTINSYSVKFGFKNFLREIDGGTFL